EVFKQVQYHPVAVAEQIAVLLSAITGIFDKVPLSNMADAEAAVGREMLSRLAQLCLHIENGGTLSTGDREAILEIARAAVEEYVPR
ncbi:MAG: hypothetical protein ROW52_08525, partial [Anaerolineaceae bacterium]